MSLKEKVDKLKDQAEAGIKKGKKAFQDGKTEVYKAVATISEKIDKREGVIGDIANVVEDVVETGKQAHADIKAQGGYGVVLKEAAQGIADATKRGVSALKDKSGVLYEKGSDLYEKLKKEVQNGEGAMDMEKVKAFLKDGARATANFGVKTVNGLTEIVNKGVKDLKDDYRTVIPSAEERNTKYAGIGTDYPGVLLRKNFEDCMAFYAYARKNLPGSLKTREQILSNIKTSASASPDELIKYCRIKHSEARKEHDDKSSEVRFAHAVENDVCWYLEQKQKGFQRQDKYRRSKML